MLEQELNKYQACKKDLHFYRINWTFFYLLCIALLSRIFWQWVFQNEMIHNIRSLHNLWYRPRIVEVVTSYPFDIQFKDKCLYFIVLLILQVFIAVFKLKPRKCSLYISDFGSNNNMPVFERHLQQKAKTNFVQDLCKTPWWHHLMNSKLQMQPFLK